VGLCIKIHGFALKNSSDTMAIEIGIDISAMLSSKAAGGSLRQRDSINLKSDTCIAGT